MTGHFNEDANAIVVRLSTSGPVLSTAILDRNPPAS
jgi:hypothetical protein